MLVTAGSCQLQPVEGEGRVGKDIPGTDDVTIAMLMTAGSCELRPVEGEGRVGEDPLLVGQAEAARGDPGPVHPGYRDQTCQSNSKKQNKKF